jgi:hypothetical protein
MTITSRARRLKARRPEDYLNVLSARQPIGRPKGRKNTRPYIIRNGMRIRDATTGRYVSRETIVGVAVEADAVFERMIQLDHEITELDFQYRIRLSREFKRDNIVTYSDIASQRKLARVEINRKRKETLAAKYVASAEKLESRMIFNNTLDRTKSVYIRFVPRDAPNVLPTARADPAAKGVPYRMSAMSGPDPMQALKMRQRLNASKGRI